MVKRQRFFKQVNQD